MARVELVRDLDRPRGWLLSVDGVAQSYVDLDDPTHLEFDYVRAIGWVIDARWPTPTPLRGVHLGGGAATVPRYVAERHPGSEALVIECDPDVVAVTVDRLELLDVPGVTLVVGDARDVLEAQPDRSAELVVGDVFDGSTVPARLLTRETFTEVRRVLAPGGVSATNIADSRSFDFARPVMAALREVFPHVALIAEPPVVRGRRFGNLVLAASADTLPVAELTRRAAGSVPAYRVVVGDDLDEFIAGADPATDAQPGVAPSPPDWAHPRN
jgi:spermidine synthase